MPASNPSPHILEVVPTKNGHMSQLGLLPLPLLFSPARSLPPPPPPNKILTWARDQAERELEDVLSLRVGLHSSCLSTSLKVHLHSALLMPGLVWVSPKPCGSEADIYYCGDGACVRHRQSAWHTVHLPLEVTAVTMGPLRPSPSQALLHFLGRPISISFLGYDFQDLRAWSVELGHRTA